VDGINRQEFFFFSLKITGATEKLSNQPRLLMIYATYQNEPDPSRETVPFTAIFRRDIWDSVAGGVQAGRDARHQGRPQPCQQQVARPGRHRLEALN